MADGQGGAIYIKKENAWVLAVEGAAAPPAAADGDRVFAGPGITITRDPPGSANALISTSNIALGSAGYVYTVHRRANAAVTGQRVSGTLYQNTTSGPISVTLVVSSREGGNVACGPTTSPPIIVDTPFDSHDGYSGRIGVHFIVPPTFYYRATWAASSGGNHIHSWCELHLP